MTTPVLQLPAAARHADPSVIAAIQSASARTGVDFAYLLAKAGQESSFDPKSKASTSSATGLYQFIDQTWLGMVKQHGAEFGLNGEAAAIRQTASGRYVVDDAATKSRILGLRTDPKTASLMGAQFAKDNGDYLQKTVGGNIGGTELYLAHFLGPAGAAKFISAWRDNPGQTAAAIFPAEAGANRGVFYGKDGQALSLDAIHRRFGKLFAAEAPIDVAVKPAAPAEPQLTLAPAADAASLFDRSVTDRLRATEPVATPATVNASAEYSKAMGAALYARTLSTLLLAQLDRDDTPIWGERQRSA